jgi:U3 small nucleolar RNA-associated protein 14
MGKEDQKSQREMICMARMIGDDPVDKIVDSVDKAQTFAELSEDLREKMHQVVIASGMTVIEAIKRAFQPVIEAIKAALPHMRKMVEDMKRERRIHYKKKRSQAKNWRKWKKRRG